MSNADLSRPDQAVRLLYQLGADSHPPKELSRAIRYVGICASLTNANYQELGLEPARYRGFDFLPTEIRERLSNDDYWRWHRTALELDFAGPLSTELRLDTVNMTTWPMAESELSRLPNGLRSYLAGIFLLEQGNCSSAMEKFREALNPTMFLTPALHGLAMSHWKCGNGLMAAEIFNMYLRIPDRSVIDLTGSYLNFISLFRGQRRNNKEPSPIRLARNFFKLFPEFVFRWARDVVYHHYVKRLMIRWRLRQTSKRYKSIETLMSNEFGESILRAERRHAVYNDDNMLARFKRWIHRTKTADSKSASTSDDINRLS